MTLAWRHPDVRCSTPDSLKLFSIFLPITSIFGMILSACQAQTVIWCGFVVHVLRLEPCLCGWFISCSSAVIAWPLGAHIYPPTPVIYSMCFPSKPLGFEPRFGRSGWQIERWSHETHWKFIFLWTPASLLWAEEKNLCRRTEIYLFIHPSIYPSFCLSIHLSSFLTSIHPFIHPPSEYRSIFLTSTCSALQYICLNRFLSPFVLTE